MNIPETVTGRFPALAALEEDWEPVSKPVLTAWVIFYVVVLVGALGGGGIGSRLVERELVGVFQTAGIEVRLVSYGDKPSDVGHWYQNAFDRRAVLDSWLQLLVPFLSDYQADS